MFPLRSRHPPSRLWIFRLDSENIRCEAMFQRFPTAIGYAKGCFERPFFLPSTRPIFLWKTQSNAANRKPRGLLLAKIRTGNRDDHLHVLGDLPTEATQRRVQAFATLAALAGSLRPERRAAPRWTCRRDSRPMLP